MATPTLGLVKTPKPTEGSGPLADHVRKGRTYSSPLVASGLLKIGDWMRDDLPDLLWPALFLAHQGSSDAVDEFVRWQRDVLADIEGLGTAHQEGFVAACLDGRLTGLDRLIEEVPEAKAIVIRRARQGGLLPAPVLSALRTYPQRPAEWLTGPGYSVPEAHDLQLLSRAVYEAAGDGHREAVLKCLQIWAAVLAGAFRSDPTTIALLKEYPGDVGSRSRADTVVRSSWGAMKGDSLMRDEHCFDAAVAWARFFWDFNSTTTKCVRTRDLEAREAATEPGPSDPAQEAQGERVADGEAEPLDLQTFTVEESREQSWISRLPETNGVQPKDLRQRAMDLMQSYVEALESGRPFRLYEPAPHEVHAGLVSRAAREVITALGAPDLWCTEHGSHVGRAVVESRIVLAWMSTQDDDIYRAYKEYGAGKAKLYARIARELPSEWLVKGGSEAIDRIEGLSHNHGIVDHVVVDTRSTFAEGKPLRVMAEEVGLLDLYRHSYQLQSGIAHSEWWSVEEHAMERCMNILHRGHLIPSLSLSYGGNVDLARSWIIGLYGLMRMSLKLLGTNEEAVARAFAWLAGDGDAGEVVGGMPAS